MVSLQVALVAVALSAAVPQRAGPPLRTPLRNAFVTATESVLDQAEGLDLNADAAAFGPGLANLKTAEQNLEAMASDDEELAVITQLKSLMFTLSSCRIQAIDGADISHCLLSMRRASKQTMLLIHKHKDNGGWADGDPRP